jgi:hypothetical protein
VLEEVGFFEAVFQHEGFIGEQVEGGAVGDDDAVVEEDGAGAELGDEFEIVGGDDFGDGEGLEEVFEFAAAAGVEVAGGFVEDEDGGLAGEDAGETDAAFFAAGEVMGGAAFKAGEADAIEAFAGAGGDIGGGQAELFGAEGDVFEHGGAEELVVGVLEEEADLAADAGEVGGGGGLAEDADGAVVIGVIGEQAVEVEKKGGFAGAVGADKPDAFAFGDGEGDVTEGGGAVGVVEVEVGDLDDVHFHPRAHMAS